MTEWISSSEPYRGNDGLCAECDNPIKLDEAHERIEGMMGLPPEHDDGLPVPVVVLLCAECETESS